MMGWLSRILGRKAKGWFRSAKGIISGSVNTLYSGTSETALALSEAKLAFSSDPTLKILHKRLLFGILSPGWTLKQAKNNAALKSREKFLKQTRFSKLLRSVTSNLVMYQNAFVEIERALSGKPVRLHLLEAPEMFVYADEHGKVERYEQKAGNGTVVEFKPDEVWHCSLVHSDTGLWADFDFEAYKRTVHTKALFEKYLDFLISHNRFRLVFTVKPESVHEDALNEFFSNFFSHDADFKQFEFIETEELKRTMLHELSDGKTLLEIINDLDKKLIRSVGVPLSIAGFPDDSNRSNVEMDRLVWNQMLDAIRRMIAEEINEELFQLLGWDDVEFVWNATDKRSEKDDLEIAERLYNMGADLNVLEEWLRSQGLQIPKDKKLFPERKKNDTNVTKSIQSDSRGKSEDLYPSRKRKGEDNKTIRSGLDDSTTREEQLIGRTANFGEYPYVIDKPEFDGGE